MNFLVKRQGWPARIAREPLAFAFAAAVLVHALFLTFAAASHGASKLARRLPILAALAGKSPASLAAAKPAEAWNEIPLNFIDTDPALAAPAPPKEAKFYGAVSTRAANPERDADAKQPKLRGTQTDFAKTATVPRGAAGSPLSPEKKKPFSPSTPGKEESKDASEKKELSAKGNTDQGAFADKPQTGSKSGKEVGSGAKPLQPSSAPERPRTLLAAKVQAGLVGEQSKQDGGVSRFGAVAFDAQGTAFGVYDSLVVQAVQQRWHDLIDDTRRIPRSGKVRVEFVLHSNGKVTDAKITHNEVGEIWGYLCQQAITDPSPYDKWPREMIRFFKEDFRQVSFTFYYR